MNSSAHARFLPFTSSVLIAPGAVQLTAGPRAFSRTKYTSSIRVRWRHASDRHRARTDCLAVTDLFMMVAVIAAFLHGNLASRDLNGCIKGHQPHHLRRYPSPNGLTWYVDSSEPKRRSDNNRSALRVPR